MSFDGRGMSSMGMGWAIRRSRRHVRGTGAADSSGFDLGHGTGGAICEGGLPAGPLWEGGESDRRGDSRATDGGASFGGDVWYGEAMSDAALLVEGFSHVKSVSA
jgi:hypothetical protein